MEEKILRILYKTKNKTFIRFLYFLFFFKCLQILDKEFFLFRVYVSGDLTLGGVAQMVSAMVCQAIGRGFKSRHSRKIFTLCCFIILKYFILNS